MRISLFLVIILLAGCSLHQPINELDVTRSRLIVGDGYTQLETHDILGIYWKGKKVYNKQKWGE